MPNGTFRNGQVTLRAITHADIPAIQDVLDHAPHYHTSIVGVPPAGLAARAFAVSSHYDTAIHNWFVGK